MSVTEGFGPAVHTVILAQLVFYMAPAVMVPSLYLQVQECTQAPGFSPSGLDVASAYAAVLTTTTIVAMAAPIPFGMRGISLRVCSRLLVWRARARAPAAAPASRRAAAQ